MILVKVAIALASIALIAVGLSEITYNSPHGLTFERYFGLVRALLPWIIIIGLFWENRKLSLQITKLKGGAND